MSLPVLSRLEYPNPFQILCSCIAFQGDILLFSINSIAVMATLAADHEVVNVYHGNPAAMLK